MKTAEEWHKSLGTVTATEGHGMWGIATTIDEREIKDIQRDAWQQGMDDAITTLDNTRQDLERLAVYGVGLVEGIIALKSAKKLGVKL